MAMSGLTRTVRFKASELAQIERFLEQNPIFDFSSLTRLALYQFIKNPQLKVTPLLDETTDRKKKTNQEKRGRYGHAH